MSAASKHLTPLLLELGGRNPCFIHKSCNLDAAVRRIVSSKYSNAGQLCIATNHVFCHRSVCDEFVELIRSALKDFYGEDPQQSEVYGRIINQHHFKRLINLLEGQTFAIGGTYDDKDKYIAPTVITDLQMNTNLISEEIFGPILPIIPVDDFEEALEHTRKQTASLQLSVFANDQKFINLIRDNTQSGGITVNDIMLQNNELSLPFGGVGESGMGYYSGIFTLEAYSQKRSHYIGGFPEFVYSLLRYPPYTRWQVWILKRMVFLPDFITWNFEWIGYATLVLLAAILLKILL